MANHPFAFVDLPAGRSTTKPRSSGLTMMIDWGLGLRRLEDTLEIAGDYVDLGKIAVGTPRLYDETLLRRKFDLYASHGIRPFLGGSSSSITTSAGAWTPWTSSTPRPCASGSRSSRCPTTCVRSRRTSAAI